MSDSIVSLYVRRARTLYVQNEFDKALVDLREALRLAPNGDPNLTWILQTLGDCYFSKRDWGSALDWYSKCIGRTPSHAYAWRWRAKTYLEIGDTEKALTDAEELIRV